MTTSFGSSTPSVMCGLPLFIISKAHFSLPNSIPISWLYIFTVCIRVSNSLSILAKSLMSSKYITWFIFSCDLLSLYPVVHFLRVRLSGIMALANSKRNIASPWNMPLSIITSVKLCLPAVNFTLHVSMVFSINCTISSGILYILRQCSLQLW